MRILTFFREWLNTPYYWDDCPQCQIAKADKAVRETLKEDNE